MTPPDADALDEQLAAALANLTPAQRTRVLAFLNGETKTAIAKREGVSPQAVDQSLRIPAVGAVFSLVGRRYAVGLVKVNGGENKPIVQALFEGLVEIALGAKRSVVHGGSITRVPDYALRFQATLRVFDFIEPGIARTDEPPPSSNGGETIAREETVVSRTREIRRRP